MYSLPFPGNQPIRKWITVGQTSRPQPFRSPFLPSSICLKGRSQTTQKRAKKMPTNGVCGLDLASVRPRSADPALKQLTPKRDLGHGIRARSSGRLHIQDLQVSSEPSSAQLVRTTIPAVRHRNPPILWLGPAESPAPRRSHSAAESREPSVFRSQPFRGSDTLELRYEPIRAAARVARSPAQHDAPPLPAAGSPKAAGKAASRSIDLERLLKEPLATLLAAAESQCEPSAIKPRSSPDRRAAKPAMASQSPPSAVYTGEGAGAWETGSADAVRTGAMKEQAPAAAGVRSVDLARLLRLPLSALLAEVCGPATRTEAAPKLRKTTSWCRVPAWWGTGPK